jgi:uncharacterized protein
MRRVLFEKTDCRRGSLRFLLPINALLLAWPTVVPSAWAQVTTTVTPSIQGDARVAELRRGAESGNVEAQLGLAAAYQYGMGIRIDKAEALRWYHQAAEAGSLRAQTTLGMIYWSGDGVSQNHSLGVDWLRRAANEGYGHAQGALAAACLLGLGAPRDPVEALKWLILAASMTPDDPLAVESARKHAASLSQSLSSEQVEQAHERARQWKAAFEKLKK